MLVKLAIALLVLSVFEQVVGTDNTDMHDSPPEKLTSQKGRLSLQNTGKIYELYTVMCEGNWVEAVLAAHIYDELAASGLVCARAPCGSKINLAGEHVRTIWQSAVFNFNNGLIMHIITLFD